LLLLASLIYPQPLAKFDDIFFKEAEIGFKTKGLGANYLQDLKVDLDKRFLFLDGKAANILIFDQDGDFLKRIGRKGEGPGEFRLPISIAVDNENNLYVLDFSLKRVSKFGRTKEFIYSFITSGGHDPIGSIKVSSDSSIYISGFKKKDEKNLEYGTWINMYNSRGKYLTSFFPSSKFNKNWVWRIGPFCSFDVDEGDMIYAAQHCDYQVSKYDRNGKLVNSYGKAPYYFKPPDAGKKIDFKNYDSQFDLIKKLKELSASWTKVVGLMVVKNKYVIIVLESNNLIKGFNKKYIIDVWDKEGKLVAGGIETDSRLLCKDKESFLYFLTYTDEEEPAAKDPQYKIGKYSLIFN